MFVTMSKYNPIILSVNSLKDAEEEIRKIGSDKCSIPIMAPKAINLVIKMRNIILLDAIIIKQDMLSVGGEVAVPKNTFDLNVKQGDILIIGNVKQIRDLVQKLKRHYDRLKKIADEIAVILKDVK